MKTTPLPDIGPLPAAAPCDASEDFVMPASIDQQRFWVLEQLAPGNAALNVPVAVEIKGPIDLDVLHEAFNAVIQRQESLRTSFQWVEGEVKQVISSDVRFYFQHKNLSSVPKDQRAERLFQEMTAEAQRPLALDKAPIFRARILRFDAEDHVLLITLHHIIADGWSTGVLLREIGISYEAILEGKKPILPELTVQYADYSLWQLDWLKSPDYQNQFAYWKKHLAGPLPRIDLPTDRPRRKDRRAPGFIENYLLPIPLTDRVKRMSQDLDVTTYMVLFSTFCTLLHRYTGQDHFILGSTVANRPRPELENLIGQFSNPMMLRADLSNEPTFRELVHRARDLTLGAMSHPEVPFKLVLEHLESGSVGRQKPGIQAIFLFQKDFMQPATFGKMTVRPLRWVSPGVIPDFALIVVERDEGICLHMEHNTNLFDIGTVRRFLRHFEVLLGSVIENPDTPIGELTLLTDAERAKLWPGLPARDTPAESTLPDIDPDTFLRSVQALVDEHLEKTPELRGVVVPPPPGGVLVVLDEQARLVPAGVLGELHLGGFAPEKVGRDSIVSGPHDSPVPIPLLRTGYFARAREDGTIEVQGLKSDLAPVNGFRVSLRQIRALLLRHPDVSDAIAVISPQLSEENQLVCYVVAKPGTTPAEKDLRATLEGRIHDLSLPAHILIVPSLNRDAQADALAKYLPKTAAAPKSSDDERIPLEAILYQQLIEIWCEILKIPTLTIEDNFFALGGTSLQAFNMMMKLEKLCGRSLPLSLLFSGATIANLAHYITEANNDAATPLYTVQGKGTKPPVFFLHGDWAGGGFYCSRVARPLGEEQPFYALPPFRPEGEKVLTMAEMAAAHIKVIQEHTPHGPYILGGYCIGAIVALEVARQLLEKGEKVAHLLLIDPPPCVAWLTWIWPLVDKVGDFLKWDLQKKIHVFDLYAVSFARWLYKSPASKLVSLFRRLGLVKPSPPSPITGQRVVGQGDEDILKSLDYAIYFLAYRIYRPKSLPISSTVFFPEETGPLGIKWRKRDGRTAECTIARMPGDHQTCITKFPYALGEKIKEAIERL
jgi:pimeloyl-ACP methyl ester carboxylesterase/acyl carrier protein